METQENSSYYLRTYSEKMNPYLLVLNTNVEFSSFFEMIMHKVQKVLRI